MKSTSTVAILLSTFSLVAVGAVSVSHAELQSKSSQGLRLLSLEENADPVWKTEDEKLELMRAHVNFVRFSRCQ
jgi:leucyl aminopeptidase